MSPRLSDLFLRAQSDERLVSLARAGHERAFAVIVERYRAELYALARRLCSDGRGEDVVQQAFLSAFAALRSGAEVKHVRGWLYQIVRNAATRSRSPLCVPLDGTTAAAETVEDIVQQRAAAMGALTELARLPTRQREAIVGTALDGRPRAEIASTMGVSEGAVRQLVHRARATLRTAASALTPWPLARWFAAARPAGPGGAEVAAGAGAASSGPIALKLGALLASGTLLTGAAAVDLQRTPVHRAGARAATPARGAGSAGHARGFELAAAPILLSSATTAQREAMSVASRRRVTLTGLTPARSELRGVRRQQRPPGRSEGQGERGQGHGDDAEANQPGDDRSPQAGAGAGSRGGDGGAQGSGSGGGASGGDGSGSRGGEHGSGHGGGGGDSREASAALPTTSGSGDGHAERSSGLASAGEGHSSSGEATSGSHSAAPAGAGSAAGEGSGSGSDTGSDSRSASGSASDNTVARSSH